MKQRKATSGLWNEGMKLVSYCPVCQTRYNAMQTHVLGTRGETHLLHVQCQKCTHCLLALVVVNQVGASSVGLLTDLSYEDIVARSAREKLSLDDVLEANQFFSKMDWKQRFISEIKPKTQKKMIQKSRISRSKKSLTSTQSA